MLDVESASMRARFVGPCDQGCGLGVLAYNAGPPKSMTTLLIYVSRKDGRRTGSE